MTFEEWWDIEVCTKDEWVKDLCQSAWDTALVNSKLTTEGYVLVPIDAATKLLKAVYGNPEIIYSMIQAAQEQE